MVNAKSSLLLKRQHGSSMIEVLVTLLIMTFGLLGLAGIQGRLQSSEMESYQRSQALLLLSDMANRIAINRASAPAYAAGAPVANPLGAGMTTCPTTTTTAAQRDLGEWCNALQGAGETSGSNKVGAMNGGRGCVEVTASGDYLVSVAWLGLTPLSEATSTAICGGGTTYDGASGSVCTGNRCRRGVTTLVRIATL